MHSGGSASVAHLDRPRPLHVGLVLLLTFVVYAPCMGNGYAMDDEPLAKSVVVKTGEPDPVMEQWQSPLFYFQTYYWWPERGNDGLYRPVTVYSYALTYNLISKPFLPPEWEATPHHVINVLLQVWATWLVMQMVVWLGAGGFAALLTGLLFGLHAIHSEVVASVIGRAELFSFCFGAQAVIWLVRGGSWRYAFAGALFFLAFCSKESGLIWVPYVPCYLLAKAWIRDPDKPIWDTWAPRLAPFLLVTLIPLTVWLVLRIWVIYFRWSEDLVGAAYSSNPLYLTGALTRILTGIKVWGYALGLCFAPFSLCCLYSQKVFDLVHSPLDPAFLGALSALVGFLVLGLIYARRSPLLFLGMATFLGFSFITSNVPMPIGTILGERLYYTPSLGICLLPAALLPWLLRRPKLLVAAMAALSVWMTASVWMIVERNGVWKSNDSLFLNDVEVHPECADLHLKAATMYGSGGRNNLPKAEEHIRKALDLQRDFPLAWVSLAHQYMELKQWHKVIEVCQQALACDKKILDASGVLPYAYSSMGLAQLELGNEADGVQALLQAFEAPGGKRNREVYTYLAPLAPRKLPVEKVRELFEQGRENFSYDAEVNLFLGGMLYQIAASENNPNAFRDYQTVAQTLGLALPNLKESMRQQENTYKGYLLLGSSLINCGQMEKGIMIYQDLMRDPALPRDLKQKLGPELRRMQQLQQMGPPRHGR